AVCLLSYLSPFCLFSVPLYSAHLVFSDSSPEIKSCRSGPSSSKSSFFLTVRSGEDLAAVDKLLVYTWAGRTRRGRSFVIINANVW
ncbi:hypothetical protein INR49_025814, partial [Caranx melampygus]